VSDYSDALAGELAIRQGMTTAHRQTFSSAFAVGWVAREREQEQWFREHDVTVITREELSRLLRKAGEGPMVFP